MKKFMLTTALCSVVAFGAAAQTNTTGTTGTAQQEMQQGTEQRSVPAFVVSNLVGKTLYTLDTVDAEALRTQDDDMSAYDRESLRWTSSDAFLADRENWEDIGEIEDVVMTQDGEVRGVILDIGGFLGFGVHTVMVDTQDLYFVSDSNAEVADDIDDFFVVISMSQEQLEGLPEWNEDRLNAGFDFASDDRARDTMSPQANDTAQGTEGAAGTQDQTAPQGNTQGQATQEGAATGGMQAESMDQEEGFGEGYSMLEGEDRTVDRLLGAEVMDALGEDIGTVDDVVLDGEESISGLLVDVGGVLGIGSHTVNLPIDQAQIGWNQGDNDVRVRVAMTVDELEAMPAYEQ